MKRKITDYVEYVSEDEPTFSKEDTTAFKKYVEELLKLPLLTLIKRWDASVDRKSGNVLNSKDYWGCSVAIRHLLRAPSSREVNSCMWTIQESFEKADAKLRNHRHETTKVYSAKPQW